MSKNIVRLVDIVEASAVFVFFYEALRVLFSVLFGVIYDALFAETGSLSVVGLLLVVVILALLTPLVAPRKVRARRLVFFIGSVLVYTARIALTFNEPVPRLVAAIVIVGGAGLYLAARLHDGASHVVPALLLALVADQILRSAGYTFDVTLRPEWWPGQVAISVILCLLAGWLIRRRPAEEPATGTTAGLLSGLAWGSWLFLETSLLAFPNALARWCGLPESSYCIASTLLLAVTLVPLLAGNRGPWRRLSGGYGLVFLLLLGAGRLLGGPAALLLLLLAQWIALHLLFAIFAPGQVDRQKRLTSGLAAGNVVFLIFSFAYAFSFTYAYTLDLFRGMGLPIVLVGGLLIALPSLRRPAAGEALSAASSASRWARLAAGAAPVLLVAILTWPHGPQRPAAGDPFRAATYNIHYGYDTFWHLSLEAQAQTIEASGADVVALQEVDTGRPTSYMIDNALWLAHRLGMEVAYLPCVEQLTGIALLSRYPILDSEPLLLPSELEQTGILRAALDVGGTPVNAFAIWMGLKPEERARQLDAALPFATAHPGPALFGGDFNSAPDSPVYARIAATGYIDPFVALGLGSPPTDPGIDPLERIDFVWLRDLMPLDARVPESTASDHRLVVVEAGLP